MTEADEAPVDILANDLARKPRRLAELRGRKVVLFHFRSWCRECRQKLPVWRRFERDRTAKFALVAVAQDLHYEVVEAFVREAGLDGAEFWIDRDGAVADAFAPLDTLPQVDLVDEGGVRLERPRPRMKPELAVGEFLALPPRRGPSAAPPGEKPLPPVRGKNDLERAHVSLVKGRPDEAARLLTPLTGRRAAVAGPALFRLGVALFDLGRRDEALAAWKKAHALDRTNALYLRRIQSEEKPEGYYTASQLAALVR